MHNTHCNTAAASHTMGPTPTARKRLADALAIDARGSKGEAFMAALELVEDGSIIIKGGKLIAEVCPCVACASPVRACKGRDAHRRCLNRVAVHSRGGATRACMQLLPPPHTLRAATPPPRMPSMLPCSMPTRRPRAATAATPATAAAAAAAAAATAVAATPSRCAAGGVQGCTHGGAASTHVHTHTHAHAQQQRTHAQQQRPAAHGQQRRPAAHAHAAEHARTHTHTLRRPPSASRMARA